MGRGRAKAKQTKVARDLKYSSPQTDFDRLQRELSGSDADDADQSESDDPWRDVAPLGLPAARHIGEPKSRTLGAARRVLLADRLFHPC